MQYFDQIIFIGKGMLLTFELLMGGLFIGIGFGILLSILRYKKMLSGIIDLYISVLRGTPLLLQLGFVYFSAPGLLNMRMSVVGAGVIAFGLNSSAYIAEIIRAGIESLPKGQFEAAITLEIPAWYMWKDIVLPQVFRNVLPALVNEVIALLKETALISTLGGMDLMRRAQSVAAEEFTYFLPLCIAGGYFYGMVLLIERLGKFIERRNKNVTA